MTLAGLYQPVQCGFHNGRMIVRMFDFPRADRW